MILLFFWISEDMRLVEQLTFMLLLGLLDGSTDEDISFLRSYI